MVYILVLAAIINNQFVYKTPAVYEDLESCQRQAMEFVDKAYVMCAGMDRQEYLNSLNSQEGT